MKGEISRMVALGAGLGIIFGAALGSAATGLVLGAAVGVLLGRQGEGAG